MTMLRGPILSEMRPAKMPVTAMTVWKTGNAQVSDDDQSG